MTDKYKTMLKAQLKKLDVDDFDYQTSEDVRDELSTSLGEIKPDNRYAGTEAIGKVNGADDPGAQIDIPMYWTDAVVRRAIALQLTPEARRGSSEDR